MRILFDSGSGNTKFIVLTPRAAERLLQDLWLIIIVRILLLNLKTQTMYLYSSFHDKN